MNAVTMMGPYKIHPALAIFPWVDDATFNAIVASIKKNGLREAIALTHDKTTMVDGRIRYAACEAANLDPVFTLLPADFTELDILNFIVSKNLRRQHLTPPQKRAIEGKPEITCWTRCQCGHINIRHANTDRWNNAGGCRMCPCTEFTATEQRA